MGPAFVESGFGGFDDVRRRGKVGLTDFEVDNAATLRFESLGADEHVEGGLDADAVHAFSKFHVDE